MPAFEYQLDIEVLGDEEVVQRLRAMGDRALFAEPALHEVLGVFRDSEEALWARGRSWEPNAAATVLKKGRNDPLRNTGALESSFTEEGDPNQIAEVTHDSVRFGSSLWYAHFALGTKGAGASHSTSQPKRDVVKIRASDRVKINAILREWILHGTEAIT